MRIRNLLLLVLFATLIGAPSFLRVRFGEKVPLPAGREEVVFWHFWGGKDRAVVADVVARFNQSQDQYWVREIAMPGNNLQAKLFLSTTGGDPPDLVNQDDPILADWAKRGVVQAMDQIADADEVHAVEQWMFDSARRLSTYDDRLFAVCNGLDIRALYYNQTGLEQFGHVAPTTLQQLDQTAEQISPAGPDQQREFYAYLPDSRRLWAWGYVFGGDFYEPEAGRVTLESPGVQAAAQWMRGYAQRYGPENIAAFRTGDQSLPGKSFPLLPLSGDSPIGRYLMLMDGQWRTRDIREFNEARLAEGLDPIQFGVAPLPAPDGGRNRAGWVNGNFFVVPKGARNREGAWEFIKFWIGFTEAHQAAQTCAAGGWIPVSQNVVDTESFQQFLADDPLFANFVEIASSPEQYPVPVIPGAPMFKRSVESAAYQVMSQTDRDPTEILAETQERIQQNLDRLGGK